MNNSLMNLSNQHKFLYDTYVDSIDFDEYGRKTTICFLKTLKGFEIVGTSSCMNPEDFDSGLGTRYSLEDALNKLGEYHAFFVIHSS